MRRRQNGQRNFKMDEETLKWVRRLKNFISEVLSDINTYVFKELANIALWFSRLLINMNKIAEA